MSIASEISRIKTNIAAAYDEAEAKGATMPATENSANLAQTVASIPEAVQPTLITKQITANGTYAAANDNADGYSEVTVNVKSGIPIDEDSLTPLVFGIDSGGFYFSDTPADETPVFFGRDSGGIYVAGGATT